MAGCMLDGNMELAHQLLCEMKGSLFFFENLFCEESKVTILQR